MEHLGQFSVSGNNQGRANSRGTMPGLQAWCSHSANGQVWRFHIVLGFPPLQVQAQKAKNQGSPRPCTEAATVTEAKVASVIARDGAACSASGICRADERDF